MTEFRTPKFSGTPEEQAAKKKAYDAKVQEARDRTYPTTEKTVTVKVSWLAKLKKNMQRRREIRERAKEVARLEKRRANQDRIDALRAKQAETRRKIEARDGK